MAVDMPNTQNMVANSHGDEAPGVPDSVELVGWADTAITPSVVTTAVAEDCLLDSNDRIEVGVSTTKRFNFLVAGGSGLGKTTFSSNALRRYFSCIDMKEPPAGPTVHIEERGRCEKTQDSTKIIITIVDTPGFGDRLNNNDRVSPVVKYIEAQNQKYEDKQLYRYPNHQEEDSRIHCCFYFIMPSRVAPIDCEFMVKLQSKVPIVPIVAKADTLERNELDDQLFEIHQCLQKHSIEIFDFKERNIDSTWLKDFHPGENLLEPSETKAISRRQIANVFAVISGQREYPWGKACESNPLHSDTPRLHEVLFRNRALQSLGRLQDRANEIHDNWRRAEEKRKEENKLKEEREEQRKKQALTKKRMAIAIQIAIDTGFLIGVIGYLYLYYNVQALLEVILKLGVSDLAFATVVFYAFLWKAANPLFEVKNTKK